MSQPVVLGVERDPFGPPIRHDGWQNSAMSYGTWRDKTTHAQHHLSLLLSDGELSSLFYTDDIAAKYVEKRPAEGFRRGYLLKDPEDGSRASDLVKQGVALDIDGKMQEAWTWARCYGGSIIVLGVEGGAQDAPLEEASARNVAFLNVVDRRFVSVAKHYENPFKPNYGKPEIYTVWGLDGSITRVHETRVIRFDGTRVDALKRRELAGWGYSVLQRPYDVMRQFATAFQAAGVLTSDASQGVFKMKGLMQMIASGEKSRLQTRMELVDMTRSAARSVLLDADGEDFQRIATQFQGLPEMLDRFAARLGAAFDMPVTLLMGTTPAGDNATGASDFKHWYDSVDGERTKDITPKLIRFYRLLSRGAATKLAVEWHPLEAPTDTEKADIDLKKAQAYQIYIDKEVLFPEEVATAQFGKDSNGQVEIDEEHLKESLASRKEDALNPPPEPVNAPPGQGQSITSSATGAGLSDDQAA